MECWRLYEEQGSLAGIDALLALAGDDVVFRPRTAEGRTLTGAAAVRRHFEALEGQGIDVRVTPGDLWEEGSTVFARAAIRIHRAGRLTEDQLTFAYTFSGPKLVSVGWGTNPAPRTATATA